MSGDSQMSFLDSIFERLNLSATIPVIQEIHSAGATKVTGSELLGLIQQARKFLSASGLRKGDRCALLAPNSIRWAALDLAIMAEGIISVPLYTRQSTTELVGMMKDCNPSRICCVDETLRKALRAAWSEAPPISLFEEIFGGEAACTATGIQLSGSDPMTIIYTSGTSGEPKGVVLTAANLRHMLSCTNARLNQLMGLHRTGTDTDRVFHYLPFCFAGSCILMLTCLSRNSLLTLSTDLACLAEELKIAAPDYFLNVPAVLERVRMKVEDQVRRRGWLPEFLFSKALSAYLRRNTDKARLFDSLWLALANGLMFPTIRKSLGPNLKALICGSAPLAIETQLFFQMLGIPVLQVYGLTETTAICTMDDPGRVTPGRVGRAISGVEMVAGENEEIFVRGPNIFPGYWERPEATAKALRDGWFHTGDQGEVDEEGNWRVIGRLKNLIILNSGHNIAPEPLEDSLLRLLPGAQQVMLVGNNRSFLAAVVTGNTSNGFGREQIQSAFDRMNRSLPHYKRIREFYLHTEPFTIENGLLTANGKFRREAIAAHLQKEIEEIYRKKTT